MSAERELVELGLSEKEAKVYVTLLELGKASAQAIARRATMVRPTTYVILDSLARKGLASKATGPDAKKMLFQAEAPERLGQYLEQQQRDAADRQRHLLDLLPSLRSLHLSGEGRPRVRLFEGKEGLRKLQQEFIAASTGEVVGMISDDAMYELFPRESEEYEQNIRSVRVQAGIRSRHIYTSSRGLLYTKDQDRAALRESRLVPAAMLPLNASFAVHGPLLSVISFRNKIIGVLIEHPDIAASFKAVFECVWALAGQRQEVVREQARAQAPAR